MQKICRVHKLSLTAMRRLLQSKISKDTLETNGLTENKRENFRQCHSGNLLLTLYNLKEFSALTAQRPTAGAGP